MCSSLILFSQMRYQGGYRVSKDVARKYRTLSTNCGPLVDEALLALEDEFGGDQPIKKSFICGVKEFYKIKEVDKVKAIEEFGLKKRNESGKSVRKSRCTQQGMILNFRPTFQFEHRRL